VTTESGVVLGDDLMLVEIERFQGPLDLLLHLIRRQDLDVFDIPIARITRQFLAAIQGIHASDLDSAGEFLDMAATLVRIKAQLLLPRPVDDDDEDPRAELVRRLLEYEQIREITQRLERAEAARSRRFAQGHVEPRPRPPAEEVPLETTWDELFEAALGQVDLFELVQMGDDRLAGVEALGPARLLGQCFESFLDLRRKPECQHVATSMVAIQV
jgi:chromatin segregation and condensation protein Rec8/ScpA/Scc1 (kleisin family)